MYSLNNIPSQYLNDNDLGGYSKIYKQNWVDIRLQNLALLETGAVPCCMCCMNMPYTYLIYYLK